MTARKALAAALLCLLIAPAMASGRAQVDYMVHCQGCHLPDGSGFPARGVPDMREVLIPFSRMDEGRAYLIQVPGSRLAALPDDRLTDVINWILEDLAVGEARAAPFTVEEVTRYRGMPLNDAAAKRVQLIEQITASPE